MASDHDESDDEFAGLIAASKVSWSAPAPTRSRKRGRETAVDADDAAPPAARTPAPPREGASPARGATPRGGSAAGRRRSTPTPADVAGSMPPPPPRCVVNASDDASDDDETTPIVPDLAPSGPKGRGSSKYYGVSRYRGRGAEWQARIYLGKKLGYDPPTTKNLGQYSTELAAAQAVDLYIHEHVPSLSAKANFPRGHAYGIAPPGPTRPPTSKYYGVSRRRGGERWKAEVYLGKKLGYDPPEMKHIGSYSTELAAAHAVDDYIYANVRGLIPKANFPRDN